MFSSGIYVFTVLTSHVTPLSRSVSIHSNTFSVLHLFSRNAVSNQNIISISVNADICYGQPTFQQLPSEVKGFNNTSTR